VAKTLLELEATGLVLDSWTEAELRASPSTVYNILGVNRIDKLPDLVVDLRGQSTSLRCAFEIENSRKEKERYDRMAMCYLAMKKINLVIFGCANQLIAQSINRSFSGEIFRTNQKVPITFSNSDFEKVGFEVNSALLHRQMPLRQMLLAALQIDETKWQKAMDKPWTAQNKNPEKSGSNTFLKQKEDQDLKAVRPSTGPLASFRDHPHSTNTLIEGGHEPGAGVGRGPEKLREVG
jgi:hypothetical protein